MDFQFHISLSTDHHRPPLSASIPLLLLFFRGDHPKLSGSHCTFYWSYKCHTRNHMVLLSLFRAYLPRPTLLFLYPTHSRPSIGYDLGTLPLLSAIKHHSDHLSFSNHIYLFKQYFPMWDFAFCDCHIPNHVMCLSICYLPNQYYVPNHVL